MTVNANKASLEIHSLCVQKSRKDFVTIPKIANAARASLALQDLNATVNNARIYVTTYNAVHELLAMPESACVHLVTTEIQMI